MQDTYGMARVTSVKDDDQDLAITQHGEFMGLFEETSSTPGKRDLMVAWKAGKVRCHSSNKSRLMGGIHESEHSLFADDPAQSS